MHKGRVTVAVMAGIGMFSSFLPWAFVTMNGKEFGFNKTFGTFRQLGVDSWLGYTNLVFFSIILVMALLGNKKNMIAKGFPKMSILVMSGLAFLLTIGVLIVFALSDYNDPLIGVYLAMAASLLTAATPYFFNADGSVDIPTVKEVIDDIEDSAEIVEDKVEDIADKVEDKIEDKLGIDDDDEKEEKSSDEESKA